MPTVKTAWMRRICTYVILFTGLTLLYTKAAAQQDSIPKTQDTVPSVSVDPELLAILDAKVPKKYVIADIKVTGAKIFDPAIVISVSGLAVGDEVTLPGADNLAKAISKLWSQNMFTDIKIYITKLEGRNIFLEIDARERPMLSDFKFKGVKKSESDELNEKAGLFKSRVVTDNMKLTAIENIEKYFIDKGYKDIRRDLGR